MTVTGFRTLLLIMQLTLLLFPITPIFISIITAKKSVGTKRINIMWFICGIVWGITLASIFSHFIK